MTIAEHPPAHRTKDAVSERAHPLAVRPFVGNRTDSAIGLDPVKRWIGIRCHVVHSTSRNSSGVSAYIFQTRFFFDAGNSAGLPRTHWPIRYRSKRRELSIALASAGRFYLIAREGGQAGDQVFDGRPAASQSIWPPLFMSLVNNIS